MDKKFSIRKLAVGVVSVSIGITGLSTISTDNITFANYSTHTVSSSSEYNGEIIYNIDGTILDFQAYVIKNKDRVLFKQMGAEADASLINKKTGEEHILGPATVKNVQDIGQVFVLEAGSYELNGIAHGEYELVLDIFGHEKNTNKPIRLKLSGNIVYGKNVTSQNESNNKDNNESKNEELLKKKESEPTFDSKTENADIPFETIYKDDNSLDKGTEITETEGINGVKEITTTYTIINGVRQDNPKVEEKITKEKVDKVVRRGTKVTSSETEKSTQNIPFETIYKDDNSLDKGTEITETEGINGVKEITTTYTIINGVRQDNPKVEEKITKEKVDKVVRRGTKVTSSETEKSTQNIPFETIYKDDNSLDKGTEITETEGINGVKEITTTYTIINGVRQDNPKVEEKITKEKVDKVVRRGTKVSTTTTPELPTNTNKPISSSTSNNKPNTVTPTDKPVNSSTNDSKPNIVAPTDKPAVDNSKPTLANITLENTNNDISVTLATAETGVKLVTDEVTNPTTLNEVKEKITNENNSITSTTDITNLRVVDLTLEKEGKKYSTNANRTVRIALLNNEKRNEILVYHVKDNGDLEELTKEKNNLTISNDSVEFTINHFSKFAIASIKKNIPTPSTNTSEEYNKNKDNRRDLTNIKPSESNQNKILPRTGVSSSSTVLLGATLLSLALISRKLKKN